MSPILVAVCLAAQHGAAAENRIDFEKQIPPWSSSPDAPIASYLQDRRKRLRWLALSFGVVKIVSTREQKFASSRLDTLNRRISAQISRPSAEDSWQFGLNAA